jgi:hypothetical protein
VLEYQIFGVKVIDIYQIEQWINILAKTMTFSFNNENLLYKYLSIVHFDICLLLLPQKSDIQAQREQKI